MADSPFSHLARLSTPVGVYEHALGTTPRIEHGMCVDDCARALVVTAREADAGADVAAMSRAYLGFLRRAVTDGGSMHNRSDATGEWLDEPSTGDHWGRAVWAFATAACSSADPGMAADALEGAHQAIQARSRHARAMAYAALGAARLLGVDPGDGTARRLLHDARVVLAPDASATRWGWPYGRLTYANAVIPEAMIAIGRALHDTDLRHDGLLLLGWLEDEQTIGTHLSVVPSGGRAPGETGPSFDQQPIELACLAEAAAAAFDATLDTRWATLIHRCEAWFDGDNDCHLPMRDPATGGACDGLEPGSVNQNQGAESTLAWLATSQLARATRRGPAQATT